LDNVAVVEVACSEFVTTDQVSLESLTVIDAAEAVIGFYCDEVSETGCGQDDP
jgi:hypothetical protein